MRIRIFTSLIVVLVAVTVVAGPSSQFAYADGAEAPVIHSLTSNEQGLRLDFTVGDRKVTRLAINRMDREDGYYQRRSGIRPDGRSGAYIFNDDQVQHGHEYCYVVVARRDGQTRGTSSNSLCAFFNGDAAAPPRPSAPTDLRALRAYPTALRLAFQDQADNESDFSLERRPTLKGSRAPWREVRSIRAASGMGRTVTVNDSGLEMEQRYCYRVRARNEAGSALSNTVCEKTLPLEVGEPDPSSPHTYDFPAIVTLTHPRVEALGVVWLENVDNSSEWTLRLYEVDNVDVSNPHKLIRTVHGHDNRESPGVRQGTWLEGLDPAKQYCVKVARGHTRSGGNLICESPFAARTSEADVGPTVAEVPTISAIERPRNGSLQLRLENAREGQLVDVVRTSDNIRYTHTSGRDGRDTVTLDLRGGETYCVRMFVTNRFGSRYGSLQCATTLAELPSRPRNLRVESIKGKIIRLRWDAADHADSYELEYKGERSWAFDHNGKKNTDDTSYDFKARSGHNYCFRVRAKNRYGTSSWSAKLCDVSLGEGGSSAGDEISYGTALQPVAPPTGPVIYIHQVNPGGNAHLRKVHVTGNAFTPYIVQFVPPGSTPNSCVSDDGVFVEPGDDLDADGLSALYGDKEPRTPVSLVSCLRLRRPNVPVASVPIQVTYVRP